MNYTAGEAIALLNNPEYQGQYGLLDLIRQVSVATPADRPGVITYTFAYSGSTGPNNTGPRMGDIADFISGNSVLNQNIRVINSSQIAEFLGSNEFKEAGLQAFNGDKIAFENWLYEAKTGPWAVASDKFIAATNGPIQPFSTFADAMRTLALVEVPTALNTPGINYIDEIPNSAWDGFRAGLVDSGMTNDAATDAVRQLISFKSSLEIQNTAVGVEWVPGENGTMQQRITWMDTSKWAVGVDVPEFPQDATRMTLGELAGPPSPEYISTLSDFVTQLKQTANIDRYWTSVEQAGKVLGTVGGVLAVADLVKTAYQANEAWQAGHQDQALQMVRDWSLGTSGAFLAGGVTYQGLAFLLEPLALLGPLGIAAGVVSVVGVSIYTAYWGHGVGQHLGQQISDLFTSATVATAPVRRDPLTFDLDNDGLETTGIDSANPIYFDHNADGVKTATGWISADDAFLVLDKNANGSIDNGRELFGDAYIKSNGQLAADGFDALRDLDGNGDGVVDASDAQFVNLRLWRDLNQDGVSQANELFTLSSQNVAAINVGSSEHSQILANGNQLADTGTFIKTDGSSGTLGEVTGNLGDINLAQDTFHSQFADRLDTSAVADLPDMQGAGQVRSLREAATLSSALAQLLTDFAAADRTGQQALLDSIIKAWSDTSTLATTFTGAYDGHNLTVNMQNLAAGSAAYNALADKLTILEHFNGRTFNSVPDGTTAATVNLWTTTQDLLQRSYDSLKESVYSSLVMQTRLKPYLDAITLTVDDSGIRLDFTDMASRLEADRSSDPTMAFANLLDLQKYAGDNLNQNGWNGIETIADWIDLLPNTVNVIGLLQDTGYNHATNGNDTFLGSNGVDNFSTGNGNDLLLGNAGNDSLIGGDGNDNLTGGLGNDVLQGGRNADVYYINRGDGEDTVIESGDGYDTSYLGGNGDKIVFGAGIEAADMVFTQVGSDLVMDLGQGDRLTFKNWYVYNNSYGNWGYQVENFQFADGTVLSATALLNTKGVDTVGTDGNDSILSGAEIDRIIGGLGNDTINAGAGDDIVSGDDGNDVLNGQDGNDQLDGGLGDDTISGGNGNDVLLGGSGNNTLNGDAGNDRLESGDGIDSLNGGSGNDTLLANGGNDSLIGGDGNDNLTGGLGNDVLQGGRNADVYYINRGDGEDTVIESGDGYDTSYLGGNGDKIVFGAGIEAADMVFTQVGSDLVMDLGQGDRLTFKNWYVYNNSYGNWGYQVENFQFADGTVLSATALLNTKGVDTVGTDGNDSILSGAEIDRIIGGLGNDTINAGAGDDIVSGDDGNDVLNGQDGNDQLDGGLGDDTISGGNGNDVLLGGSGNNTLNGDAGNDRLESGDGIDSLNGGSGNDTLLANGGNDSLIGGDGNDNLTGGLGNDVLQGGRNADVYYINRGDGEDTVIESGDGYDTSYLGGNGDKIVFGAGIAAADMVFTQVGSDLVMDLGQGDRLTFKNWYVYNNSYGNWGYQVENFQFADGTVLSATALLNTKGVNMGGTDANDVITGGAETNYLYGGLGDDTINAGAGDDIVSGDDGNDVLNGQDGNDQLDGGLGDDTISGGNGNDVLLGGSGNNTLNGDAGNDRLESGDGIDSLNGGSGNDTLLANGGNDSLIGGDGNDNLTGGLGNDVLQGGRNADVYYINRGDGEDTVIESGDGYDTSYLGGNGDKIVFGAGIEAADMVFTQVGSDLVMDLGQGDRLTFKNWYVYNNSYGNWGYQVENFQFADGTVLSATALLNTKGVDTVGTDGNDSILSGAEIDRIIGGLGNDTINAGAGDDIVSGDDGNDVLNGQDGNDQLDGGLGDDTISGGNGNDVLLGGSGNNTLNGDAGNDRLESGDGIDSLNGGSGNDTLLANGGNDSLIGGDGNDNLTGGLGNDVLQGGRNADVYYINRGDGEDTVIESGDGYDTSYLGGNGDKIVFGAGIEAADMVFTQVGSDLVMDLGQGDRLTFKNWYVYNNSYGNWGYQVENFQFADGTVLSATALLNTKGVDTVGTDGNDSILSGAEIDRIIGGLGNDTINAGAGDDIVSGDDGNDVLNGQDGNDQLDGGLGDDTISGGNGNDVLLGGSGNNTLNGDAGNDRLESGDGIDSLNGGSGNDTLLANGGNDSLIGGDGNDNLTGGLGNDVLQGGRNADVYYINRGDGEDTVIESGDGYDTSYLGGNGDKIVFGAGIEAADMVFTQVGSDLVMDLGQGDRLTFKNWYVYNNSYGNWGYQVENFQFADGTVLSATALLNTKGVDTVGTDGNDSILSGAEIDRIIGGLGNDTINAGAGDDIVSGDDGNDVLNGQDGNDQLDGGLGDDTISGGNGNDVLLGGSGNNTLNGDAGNDRLESGDGIDSLNGGSGNDTLLANGGNDSLIGGDGNDNLTGGLGNDVLQGGRNADVYYINRGDGEDTVIESGDGYDTSYLGGNGDKIVFGAGIEAADMVFTQVGSDLVMDLGQGDRLTFKNWYVYNNSYGNWGYQVENFQFADGTVLSATALLNTKGVDTVGTDGNDSILSGAEIDRIIGGLGNDTINAGAGDDIVSGDDGNDVLNGQDGNDQLDGGLGDDTISGGNGNDVLLGGSGNNTLNGDAGNDRLESGDGIDSLNGGSGNDTLLANGGNDSLIGGDGNDNLTGGLGNDVLQGGRNADVYYINRGDGEDTVIESGDGYDTSYLGGNGDKIVFGAGIAAADMVFTQVGSDLVMDLGQGDRLTFKNWYVYNNSYGNWGYQVENFQFADGTVLSATALLNTKGVNMGGTDANDVITGGAETNYLYGGLGDDNITADLGDDYLNGGVGNDVLNGQAGNDTLNGETGNDILNGGGGNDYLVGGAGSDVYLLGLGDGQDIVYEYDATAGNVDKISFESGIAAEQLWFRHVGSDLELSIIGTDDKTTISNWYTGSAYHIEQFTTTDGLTLLDSQVENLVNAMADFAPPAAGQTTLPQDYQDALAPVLAANWQ
ncbi:calcium-binding protein [Methylomonas rapida]|uniref:Haemolysin-type calcium binding-related domain-containing protein n=1 Tax=Methylomonas rapida TaxID=2963939 RepID=A0ABY7GD88_9GAMM|nr:calcium-binding protein [Methylomonas rapida]WAR43265.1 hypothetical protein NM686_012785 [Methylomonas rapida]